MIVTVLDISSLGERDTDAPAIVVLTSNQQRSPVTITVSPKQRLAVPDGTLSDQAAHAAEAVAQLLERHPEASVASLTVAVGDDKTVLDVPVDVLELLAHILAETASGNAVAVAPVEAELTTQQAADLLNVSRPYLVKLLDERRIPFRRVGNRRRILLADVMAFKHVDESERRAIAAELTTLADRLEGES